MIFLLHFWNFHQIYNIVIKKMSLLAKVFPKLLIAKEVVLKRWKAFASEHLSGINVVTGSTRCSNKHSTTINLFLHEYGGHWVGKSLPYSDLKF